MLQIQKIVMMKYMNDHPRLMDKPTGMLILWALMDAYPVKKK